MAAKTNDHGPDEAADTRWLTAQEREAWLRLLALTARLPSALDTQLQRDSGLTLFEYTVLAALSEQSSQSLRMGDLALMAQGSLSRLSHVAAKLERYGLIHRRPSPENGRFTEAVLTSAGLARVQAVAPGHVAFVRSLVFDALPADRLDLLAQAAESILTQIDPDPGARPWVAAGTGADRSGQVQSG